MDTQTETADTGAQELTLGDKLKLDLQKAKEQLAQVNKQFDDYNQAQQTLMRQRIALEALVGYLSSSLGN